MKPNGISSRCRRAGHGAFTLIEVLIAMAVVGVVFVALYSGMTYGFSVIQYTRENLRATQILLEKAETIRLYTWSQLNDGHFIPKKFTESYYPPGLDGGSSGIVYEGEFKVKNMDLHTNYDDEMKQVVITLGWRPDKKGKPTRTRTLTTYVAENGLHKYIF